MTWKVCPHDVFGDEYNGVSESGSIPEPGNDGSGSRHTKTQNADLTTV